MSTEKPYSGLSRDRLTNLINEINGRSRIENVDFTYGHPHAQLGPNGENTVVTITPVPGTSYRDSQDIYYTRLPISIVSELPYNVIEPAYLPTVPFSIISVLPEINRALGLNLETSEVIDQQYTEYRATYTLAIDENKSLGWVGSIEFHAITQPLLRLNSIISDQLFGFIHQVRIIPELIQNQPLDGFDPKWPDIEEVIYTQSLNGFEYTSFEESPTGILLSSIVTNTYLDVFDLDEPVYEDEFAFIV